MGLTHAPLFTLRCTMYTTYRTLLDLPMPSAVCPALGAQGQLGGGQLAVRTMYSHGTCGMGLPM